MWSQNGIEPTERTVNGDDGTDDDDDDVDSRCRRFTKLVGLSSGVTSKFRSPPPKSHSDPIL